MALKEKKSQSQPHEAKNLNKLSFLSIRNLWTNPSAANVLERIQDTNQSGMNGQV